MELEDFAKVLNQHLSHNPYSDVNEGSQLHSLEIQRKRQNIGHENYERGGNDIKGHDNIKEAFLAEECNSCQSPKEETKLPPPQGLSQIQM